MIHALLERAGRRAESADACLKADETLTLLFESGRLVSTAWSRERGVNLRVRAEGRVGSAGSTGSSVEALVEAARAAAALGDRVDLLLPAPAPLPSVRTASPAAAAAGVADLVHLGEGFFERVARDGHEARVVVERSVGGVRVANTRGVEASYDVTGVTLSAEVTRGAGSASLSAGDRYSAADLPAESDLAALAESILRRLRWAERTAECPRGELPVLFTPAAVAALLLPLRQACQGKAVFRRHSPLAGRLGEPAFDPRFTLTDDPWVPGAPGSRAVDDEGVPTRRVPLVRSGVVAGFIYELETAALAGVPATGHARRTTFGKPQAGYSNLVVSPGEATWAELLAMIPDGLVVDALGGVGEGNVIGGAFSHPVALGWRVLGGEITGRVAGATVAGNVYELLADVGGIGREVERRGSLATPALLLQGVSVAPR